MAAKNSSHPQVKIARPKGRPFQIWYKCPDTGRKVRMSTGCRDEQEAERQRAELEARLLLGLKTTSGKKLAGPSMAWEDFRDEYSRVKAAPMRSGSAIHSENRLDIAERIIRPRVLGDMATHDALERLQLELLSGSHSRFKRPRSSETVKGYMRSIKAALNWAVAKGWLDPLPRIEALSVEESDCMKGRPLVGEEIDRMLAATPKIVGDQATPSWQYILRGVICSGLRLEELMTISWDVPQTIQPVWRKGRLPVLWFPGYLQKNKKTQEIPLCPWFEDLLMETLPELRTGWVFEPMSLEYTRRRRYRGERLSAERVGKVVSKIGKAAGVIVDEGNARTGSPVKHASTHDLRRTFAQKLADSNLPPELVRKLMRHADIRTTERYYQVQNVQRDAGKIRELLGQSANRIEKSATACQL